MTLMQRLLAAMCLLLSSEALPAQSCDPENFDKRSKQEKSAINKAFNSEPSMTEMVAYLGVPATAATSRIMEMMLRCQLPVSGNQGGIITADYGKEKSIGATYTLSSRAIIIPAGDSGSVVRLVATETSEGTLGGGSLPVSNKNDGRSRNAWIQLRYVMKQILVDPALKADREKSTKIGAPFLYESQKP